MPFEVDPVEFGRLVQAVETQTHQITILMQKIEMIEDRLSSGKGLMMGVMVTIIAIAGGAGAMMHKFLEKLADG